MLLSIFIILTSLAIILLRMYHSEKFVFSNLALRRLEFENERIEENTYKCSTMKSTVRTRKLFNKARQGRPWITKRTTGMTYRVFTLTFCLGGCQC